MESIAVVKLGTNVITKGKGCLDEENIARLAEESKYFFKRGRHLIVVSSGAIGAGCGMMSCRPEDLSINQKQAMASIGQPELMNAYRKCFARQGRKTAQLLLSSGDLAERKSYLNSRNTIFTLLQMGVVPIINENDTVAVEEIKLGDNDRLASVVASKMDAEMLVLLTDVDGLMDKEGSVLKEVNKLDESVLGLVNKKTSNYSVGGMKSKLEAAEMFSRLCGGSTYIASGRKKGVLKQIAGGVNPGTVFTSGSSGLCHRKRWIAHGLKSSGSLYLDEGALEAITKNNASLLPVGIKKIVGRFSEGDFVSCVNSRGQVVARGLVNYSSEDLKKIKGKSSCVIEEILGYKTYDEAIHRDNLAVE
ncbi:MAG: glutamate 5-kinase [Elusimicrobiota bacterium]